MPAVTPPRRARPFGAATVLLLLLAGPGQAQTYTWNGNTSSSWATGSNWDLGTAPGVNADLVFGSAGLANLPTDNFGSPQPRSMTFNDNLGAPLTVSGQGLGIGSGGITQASSNPVTLDYHVQLAASQTWATAGGGGLTVAKLGIVTSETSLQFGSAATRASGAFTLTGDATGEGFVNINTTSGRTATLWHNVTLSASQQWTGTSANARTVVNGDLSAAPGVTLTIADSNGAAPNFRFGGTNAAFLGDLTTSTPGGVVLLDTPSAMIGGRVLVNAGDRLFGITGALGANTPPTYTFDYAAGTAPAAPGHGRGIVAFSGSGAGGLYASRTARWDPGAGADYLTPEAPGANTIDLAAPTGSFLFPGGTIRFGTTGTNFVLRSDFTVRGPGGANQSPLLFDYALSDDGAARQFTTAGGLTILTRPRAATNALGTANLGGATTAAAGLLSINGADRLFTGNLALTGGTLVFDGMSWNSFASARTPGTGPNQYQFTGGGFAARGSAVTIDASSTTAGTFDRDFSLGSPLAWQPDGNSQLYANAGVTVARNTVLTARRTVGVYSEGPGLTGAAGGGFVHGLTGGFSDDGVSRGALVVRASANAFFQDKVSELVLGGTNDWTGSAHAVVGGWHLNSGPGGLLVGDGTLLVRFADPASLPAGNAGQPAFLAAVRNSATFTTSSGLQGFLFTGTAGGQTYTLPAGMRILVGGAGTGGNSLGGILGSTGGSATLAGAPVYVNMVPGGNAINLNVHVRDGTFTLGTGTDPTGAVSFAATQNGAAGSDTGVAGAASPVFDRVSGFTTLVKSGPGLLVLQNVRYTDVAGTGPFAGGLGGQSLTWSVGSGIVRDTAADLANFGPAAINLSSTIEAHGSMTRALGFTANTLTWSNGGFAAVGGPLSLNVGGAATPSTLTWGSGGFMVATGFAPTMTLGSANADGVVTLANPVDLNNGTRVVQVLDNPNSAADYAVFSGNLTGSAAGSGLTKTGAGRLDLQGPGNSYAGRTLVSDGRLNVNGVLSAGGGGVTAQTAGTLGGTGTISRPVTISGGGTLNPGAAAPGTLTVNPGVVFDPGSQPATFAARLAGPGSADRLVVNGNVSLNGATLGVSLGYAPDPSDRFFLIVNNGANPVAGQFAGLADGDSRTFTFNGTQYTGWVYYTANFDTDQLTGGNDVVLTFTPVPEPASVLGVAAAAAGLLALRRRLPRQQSRP
jgi:autotransporter-associated beta strand protein